MSSSCDTTVARFNRHANDDASDVSLGKSKARMDDAPSRERFGICPANYDADWHNLECQTCIMTVCVAMGEAGATKKPKHGTWLQNVHLTSMYAMLVRAPQRALS